MSEVLNDRFQRGIRLCRDHISLAVRRADHPGLAPPLLEEEVKGLPPEERKDLLCGYETELKRYEMGVLNARSSLDKLKSGSPTGSKPAND